jgi:hypothetical protein
LAIEVSFHIGPNGIQNPGVDRMSEMSSMLYIVLYRDAASRHELNEWGNGFPGY